MKKTTLILAASLIVACATQDEATEENTHDTTQAVRDYIEVRDLPEADKIPTASSDSWTILDDRFLLYKGRRETHLIEFSRRCWELEDNSRIVADVRRDAKNIYSRFDTIRGCRIHRIYGLEEYEAAELENIGEAVGSRS